jgi:hypothetical protein
MSRANGQVWIDNKVVAYFIYNGTCDVVLSGIFDTQAQAWDAWDKDAEYPDCTCDNAKPCLLLTDYGSAHYWPGRVCLDCRCITDGIIPRDTFCGKDVCYQDNYCRHYPVDGYPDGSEDWWMKKKREERAAKGMD